MKSRNYTAYLDTVFEFNPSKKPKAYWVITAHNPNGKTASPGDNNVADGALRAELEDLKIPCFRVIGRSRDGKHAEPGWGIDCNTATAIKLGKRYRQEALFHFSAGRIDLVDCKTGERVPMDDPESRILDPRDQRHFTLFVGSPGGRKKIDPGEYLGVCTRIGAYFQNFTIQTAEGCCQSRFEDVLLIHIATREPQKILTAAHDLRCFLSQADIGISHNGIYQRVLEWSDDEMILNFFGITLITK